MWEKAKGYAKEMIDELKSHTGKDRPLGDESRKFMCKTAGAVNAMGKDAENLCVGIAWLWREAEYES